MVSVVYEAPDTIEAAVGLLAGSPIPAMVLAGGTDLIIQTNASKDQERLIVDIKNINGMCEAALTDSALELGPSMNCAEFTSRGDIKSVFPGLVEAAYMIGSTQVQGRASVGGNLCNSSPAADTIPALIANAAICEIAGPDGERSVAVKDFITGVGTNCLVKGELLKVIRVPRPVANTSDAYLRFIPRTEMDIAVAGAGVSLTLDEEGLCTAARVAIGAVAPTAIAIPKAEEALVGSNLNDEAIEAAAGAATAASKPIDDRRGTIEFRRHVVGVLVKRAIRIAANRVKGL